MSNFPIPYPYQNELLDGIEKGWAAGFRKQLVVSPTGSGKTKAFSWQTKNEVDAGRRVLILVDQKELIDQTIRQLRETAGIIGEVERAEFYASKMCQVVVATIQTMAGRKESWPAGHFDLVIADEADKSISPQWLSVLKYFDPVARVTGYTATPNRTDKRNLGEYYENIAFEISLIELVKQKYLSPICIQMAPLRINLGAVSRDSKGDYDVNDLDHAITPYLQSAVEAIKTFAPDRKTLVFLPLIKTSQTFVELCRQAGLMAEHIDGGSEDRTDKLSRFKRNEFTILANSSLLLRGYDDPDINCVFILRPTTSSTLYQQCVGRGIRLALGKENLLLIDCLWQMSKHMVMRPASLIAETDEEAEEITNLAEESAEGNPNGELDLLSLQDSARHAREEALAKKLEKLRDKKALYISVEQFASDHKAIKIAEFEPTMPWHSDPASPAQLKYLEKAGIDVSTIKNKGQASMALDVVFKESGSEPASSKQRWAMNQANWRSKDNLRSAWQATKEDARQFFASRNGAKPKAVKNEPATKPQPAFWE